MKNLEERKKQIIAELTKEAQYYGEDGNTVVISKTQRGAWLKIRKVWRRDTSDSEVEDINLDHIDRGVVEILEEGGEYDSCLLNSAPIPEKEKAGVYISVWVLRL